MTRTKNELTAYMDGYGDAFADFRRILCKYHADVTSVCWDEMNENIRRLNRAICNFRQVVLKEDKHE